MIEIRASDLRQWLYCPRIVYYGYMMEGFRPVTPAMVQGRAVHEADVARERRRGFRFYGLEGARREFRPRLRSEALGLTGIPDLVLVTDEESVPVEMKVTERQPGPGVLLQLAAYALLLDESDWPPTRRGFVRNLPSRATFQLVLGGRERRAALEALEAVREMLARDMYPEPTPVRARCRSCEYRVLCPDVWE
ncbi:MAG: CRISPR-associated protein Cas4 [Armatimonadota bacterium]